MWKTETYGVNAFKQVIKRNELGKDFGYGFNASPKKSPFSCEV